MRTTNRRAVQWYGLAGAMLLVMSGCDTPRVAGGTTDAGMPSVRRARAVELLAQPNRYARGVEDEFLQLESGLPGFGGFFMDKNGDIVAVSSRYRPAQPPTVRCKVASQTTYERPALASPNLTDRNRRWSCSMATTPFPTCSTSCSEFGRNCGRMTGSCSWTPMSSEIGCVSSSDPRVRQHERSNLLGAQESIRRRCTSALHKTTHEPSSIA